MTATGSDFATTMKVTLTADARHPGRQPLRRRGGRLSTRGRRSHVTSVSLRFTSWSAAPTSAASDARSDARRGDAWIGQGTNLSVAGHVAASPRSCSRAPSLEVTHEPEHDGARASRSRRRRRCPGSPRSTRFTLPDGQELQAYNDPGWPARTSCTSPPSTPTGQGAAAGVGERGRDHTGRRIAAYAETDALQRGSLRGDGRAHGRDHGTSTSSATARDGRCYRRSFDQTIGPA